MDPSHLFELALLIAGLVLAAVALNRLFTRRRVRALQLGAAAVALFAIAFYSGTTGTWRYPGWVRTMRGTPAAALLPAAQSDSLAQEPGAKSTMSLVLGGVPVLAPVSDKYVVASNGEEFLTIDAHDSGLLVSCDIAGSPQLPLRTPELAARFTDNVVWFIASNVMTIRPNASTLLVREDSTEILRVRYAAPRRIEVDGQFSLSKGRERRMVVLADGIRWPGGSVPTGSSVDLRPQGKGVIELTPSGAIQVVGKWKEAR